MELAPNPYLTLGEVSKGKVQTRVYTLCTMKLKYEDDLEN